MKWKKAWVVAGIWSPESFSGIGLGGGTDPLPITPRQPPSMKAARTSGVLPCDPNPFHRAVPLEYSFS
jgi:hypothetical protein